MDTTVFSNIELFESIRPEELRLLFPCLQAAEKHYTKGELIFRAGETVKVLGIVISGSVNVLANYYWGGSSIFGHVEAGQIFGETYAALPQQ